MKSLSLEETVERYDKHLCGSSFKRLFRVSFCIPVFLCSSSDSLEPTYQQLQKMKLDKSPFVVVSVVGQELLTAGHHGASVVVLEAALKIGTCSLKLRGSVFSALSSAHWSLGNTEKSTGYMQQDLDVAKTLGTAVLLSLTSVQEGNKESSLSQTQMRVTYAAVSERVSRICSFLVHSGLEGFSCNKIPGLPKGEEMWINICITFLRDSGSHTSYPKQ